MAPSTHSPYSCLQLDTLRKSWLLVPPARCATGVHDPRNGGAKMDPRFALAHNVFLLAGPIRVSILALCFGSCGAQILVTEMPKMVPGAFQKNALRNKKNLRQRPENQGRSTCANQELSDDAVPQSLKKERLASRNIFQVRLCCYAAQNRSERRMRDKRDTCRSNNVYLDTLSLNAWLQTHNIIS